MRNALLTLCCLLLLACASKRASSDVTWNTAPGAPLTLRSEIRSSDVFISRRGGRCTFNCPDYELILFGDGRVVFRGERDTLARGLRRGQVPAERFIELRQQLIDSRLFEAPPPPQSICADAPYVLIQARFDGQLHERSLSTCDAAYAVVIPALARAAHAEPWIRGREERF
jgi:Domain of unknown function (DUF6438)